MCNCSSCVDDCWISRHLTEQLSCEVTECFSLFLFLVWKSHHCQHLQLTKFSIFFKCIFIAYWQILCILPCSLFFLSSRSFHLGCPMQVKASLCWKPHCFLERGRTMQSLSADTPFTVEPTSSRPKEGGRGARAPSLWSQTLVSRENTQRFPFK